jgi:hypothetical protein
MIYFIDSRDHFQDSRDSGSHGVEPTVLLTHCRAPIPTHCLAHRAIEENGRNQLLADASKFEDLLRDLRRSSTGHSLQLHGAPSNVSELALCNVSEVPRAPSSLPRSRES